MPANVGNQDVTLMYHTVANANEVNARFRDNRKLGVYKGGYLTKNDDTHVQLSPLACEITNGPYQVKIETTEAVNIVVAPANPYVVLRWVYAGTTSDYMEILAVTSPTTYDLVIGKCVYTGSTLQGIDSSERSTPNTLDLFLKVEAPDSSMLNKMKVRVRAGRIVTNSGVVQISDQQTSSQFTHSGGGLTEYGLVYIDTTGVVCTVNASGNTSIPSFEGKMVLAIVAIISSTTVITQSMIADTRNFITPSNEPDNTTIERGSDGKWRVKSSGVATGEGEVANGANFTVQCGAKGEVLVKLYMMFKGNYGSFGPVYARLRTAGGSSTIKERWAQVMEWGDRYSSVVVPVVKKFAGYSANQVVTFNAYTPQGSWVRWIDYEYIGT